MNGLSAITNWLSTSMVGVGHTSSSSLVAGGSLGENTTEAHHAISAIVENTQEPSSSTPCTDSDKDRKVFRIPPTREVLEEVSRMGSPPRLGFSMVDWSTILRNMWYAKKRNGSEKKLPYITKEEIMKHNTPDDLWIVVNSVVYDCTKFQHYHPAGARLLQRCGGKDSTELFDYYHRWVSCESILGTFAVGLLHPDQEVVTGGSVEEDDEAKKEEPTRRSTN
uniref:Cytochrome b5 heme-binding domain-containing protein n=1 Tax=Trypanosoma congolense (strain IL3000) TaxID=1068625 RepID=G0UPB1_TRYCI|nr:conserved hypothetical protein [Trypanosoma congolense IL3000]